MSNKKNIVIIIRFTCIILINFLTLHSSAQVKLSTFTLNGEEYEVMPADENGGLTWWEATERCFYKQAYGYSDWFIPDVDQLRALYAHQNTIGGFTNKCYWSSTQHDQYSSVIINFEDGQSFPEGKVSRGVKCRYIRKTGRIKTQEDYLWIYGEWIGKYRYYTHVWKEAYIVVFITPQQIVITDNGVEKFKGKYVIKDDLIEYVPYHNKLGWIGEDKWGFLEIMTESHQLGSGYNRVLDKSKSYNYTTPPPQANQQNTNIANITIKAAGCEIFIDGKSIGHELWTGNLQKGKHKVKVNKECYEPYEKTIDVVENKYETFTITPQRLKKHNIEVKCNANNATALIDGKEMSFDQDGTLSLCFELEKSHNMTVSAPKYVPITITFCILEDKVICKKQEGLSSYKGELSSLNKFDLNEMDIQLKKLKKHLYYGNDNRYIRPNYKGPVLGEDRIIVSGMSIGSEIGYVGEFYGKSRIMATGTIGMTALPICHENFLLHIGYGIGWQIFRGIGLRVTPVIGATGYSLLQDAHIAINAKVSVSYPLTNRFVIGVTPMFGVMVYNNPFSKNTYGGVSLYLGWQKREKTT